jgi:ketosteroid isomerase-like protein
MATNDRTNDKAEIRGLLDETTRALHAKDAERLMSRLAPGARMFDLAPPLAVSDPATLRKGLVDWFATFDGPVGYTFHDMSITCEGDIAFGAGFAHIQGKRTTGEQQTDVWLRATICWRRENGRWTVAHQHMSVPFYMDGSLKAAVDLKP